METIDLRIGMDTRNLVAARRTILRDLKSIEQQAKVTESALTNIAKLRIDLVPHRLRVAPGASGLSARPKLETAGAGDSRQALSVGAASKESQKKATRDAVKQFKDVLKTGADQFRDAVDRVARLGALSDISGFNVQDLQKGQIGARFVGVDPKTFERMIQGIATNLAELALEAETAVSRRLSENFGLDLRDKGGAVATNAEVFTRLQTKFDELDSVRKKLALLSNFFGADLAADIFPFFQRFKEAVDSFDLVAFPGAPLDQDQVDAARFGVKFATLVEVELDLLNGLIVDKIARFRGALSAAEEGLNDGVEGFEKGMDDLRKLFDALKKFWRDNKSPEEFPPIIPDAASVPEASPRAKTQLVSAAEGLMALEGPLKSIIDLREREAVAIGQVRMALGQAPGSSDNSFRTAKVSFRPNSGGTLPKGPDDLPSLDRLASAQDAQVGPLARATDEAERFASAQANISAVLREQTLPAFEEACTATETLGHKTSEETQVIEEVLRGAFGRVEQALLQFVETGKLNFKDLIRSILLDITKLMISRIFNQFIDLILGGLSGAAGGGAGAITTPATSVSGGSVGGTVGFGVAGIFGAAFGASDGGLVRGPGTATSDSIPARLSNGEFVVNASAAGRHRDILEAINSGGLAGLRFGGLVGMPEGPARPIPGVGLVPLRPLSIDERLAPVARQQAGEALGAGVGPSGGDARTPELAADMKEVRVILGDIRKDLRRGARRGRGPREEGIGFGRSGPQMERQAARSAQVQARRN